MTGTKCFANFGGKWVSPPLAIKSPFQPFDINQHLIIAEESTGSGGTKLQQVSSFYLL